MRHMDPDERVVAEALARFLRDGDETIPIGPGKDGVFFTMTMHRAGHSFADDRRAIARVVGGEELVEYEVEIVARRKT